MKTYVASVNLTLDVNLVFTIEADTEEEAKNIGDSIDYSGLLENATISIPDYPPVSSTITKVVEANRSIDVLDVEQLEEWK